MLLQLQKIQSSLNLQLLSLDKLMTISSQIIENWQRIYAEFKHFVAVKIKYRLVSLIIISTTMLMITEQHFGSAGIIVFIAIFRSVRYRLTHLQHSGSPFPTRERGQGVRSRRTAPNREPLYIGLFIKRNATVFSEH